MLYKYPVPTAEGNVREYDVTVDGAEKVTVPLVDPYAMRLRVKVTAPVFDIVSLKPVLNSAAGYVKVYDVIAAGPAKVIEPLVDPKITDD